MLGEDRRLRAGKIDERGVRLDVSDALQERREVGIGERQADQLDDLAADLEESGFERRLGIDAGHAFNHQGDNPLSAVLQAHAPMIHDCGLSKKPARTK